MTPLWKQPTARHPAIRRPGNDRMAARTSSALSLQPACLNPPRTTVNGEIGLPQRAVEHGICEPCCKGHTAWVPIPTPPCTGCMKVRKQIYLCLHFLVYNIGIITALRQPSAVGRPQPHEKQGCLPSYLSEAAEGLDRCFTVKLSQRRECTYIYSEIGTDFIEESTKASKKEQCVRCLEEGKKGSRRQEAF